ncbi:dioxygenase [Burkholderia gladioli pv. gladioli]|uniref:6-chlorohydroxyquinol-1,2-dioxygenase n=1 Tax=Burkholderia gladioli TaxID=28095 RepID=A0A095F393_BURGA|nr:dioxygenase [Burkholderia gladioli]AJW98986.1 dioxygenase family protein [Burkholderia gladioli]ASD79936.1 6-chlorohydroxyquinol-1,2-dioxygenase [Burkholderia gladioli pv. gladioli]AWY54819.1 6-chlorohydroxyquinol-1,2-dioxygenase [Burkholderia gladioli pv. gladioli]KGC11455.1 dioxygenase family protein [Burkholderia gladioli]MDJ1164184.1 dioxygenase [Burkholderia gladioli pv. gladioli]
MNTNRKYNFPLFREEDSAAIVNARIGSNVDARTHLIAETVVRHLHAAVKEIEPTHDEWHAAIRFLTDTGHMCTDWRQEFILLSDVLGVSMLVDAINHRRPDQATENTILGPFFVEGVEASPHGVDICKDGKGEPLVVVASVRDTEGKPIQGAVIDVWQTNDDGFYDVQQKGIQPEGNLRGKFVSDADGAFWFKSVKPRHYPIPDDGPVGKLLRKLGRHPNRAAHMHFLVQAPGYDTVITHIFSPDCPWLAEDTVFGVKESLIGNFVSHADQHEARSLGFTIPFWSVHQDFVLNRTKTGFFVSPGA